MEKPPVDHISILCYVSPLLSSKDGSDTLLWMKRKAVHIIPRYDGRVEVNHTLVSTDVHPNKGEPRYGDIADILGCESVMNVHHAGYIITNVSEETREAGEYCYDVFVVNPDALIACEVVQSKVYWSGDLYGHTLLGEMLITGRYVENDIMYMADALPDIDFTVLVGPVTTALV